MKSLLLYKAILFSFVSFAATPAEVNVSESWKTIASVAETNPRLYMHFNSVNKGRNSLNKSEIPAVTLSVADSIALVKNQLAEIDREIVIIQDTVLNFAFSLLKIPHDEFLIKEIAIPIYEKALKEIEDKTEKGERDRTILENFNILINSKKNSSELKEILQVIIDKIEPLDEKSLSRQAPDWLRIFKVSPVYEFYKRYPQSKETFIWGIIQSTESLLESLIKANYPNFKWNTIKMLKESMEKLNFALLPTESTSVKVKESKNSNERQTTSTTSHQTKNSTQERKRTNLDSLKNELSQKQKKLNNYYLNLIDIGSNFLFLPYDKTGIEEIALPAMMASRDYSKFDEYEPRVELLKNFDKDQQVLKEFIEINKNKPSDNLTIWAPNFISKFNQLDVVMRYKDLGDGWEETYLGQFIQEIEEAANSKKAKEVNYNLQKIFLKL